MWKYEGGESWMRLSGSHVLWERRERRRGSPRSSYRRQGQVTIYLEGEAMMSLLNNWIYISRTGLLLRINVYRVCFSNAEIETMTGKLPSLHLTQASVSPEKEWCSLRMKVSLPKTHTVSGASRTTESRISTNSGPTNCKMHLPISYISCCQEWWL